MGLKPSGSRGGPEALLREDRWASGHKINLIINSNGASASATFGLVHCPQCCSWIQTGTNPSVTSFMISDNKKLVRSNRLAKNLWQFAPKSSHPASTVPLSPSSQVYNRSNKTTVRLQRSNKNAGSEGGCCFWIAGVINIGSIFMSSWLFNSILTTILTTRCLAITHTLTGTITSIWVSSLAAGAFILR
jgi:hypothetical protein